MPGGDLTGYIANHANADRPSLVGFPFIVRYDALTSPQLFDVAEGLRYLHSRNVIHGDLKCVCDCSRSCFVIMFTLSQSNILVDATGRARITDFGLAAVTRDPDSMWSVSTEHDKNVRWIAPEILDNRWAYSKEADVFSFAGVTIEVRRR